MAKKNNRRSQYSSQQERRELRAKELFTDRHEERALLAEYLDAIVTPGKKPDRPIISFYGVGGVGKSTLISYVWDQFYEKNPDNNVIYINLDVDSDKAEDMSAVQLLWNLRMKIYQATESSLLGFDFLYLKYMEKANEQVSLDDGPVRHFFEGVAKRSGMFGTLFRGLGTVIEILPIGNMMSRGLKHIQERDREKELMRVLDIDLNSIDSWRAGDIERKLPGLLAEDLGLFLVENQMSFVLVLDGYERVTQKTERSFVEGFLSSLLLDEEYAKHAGVILLGRERTNWAAYDDPNDDTRWNHDFIDHRHLLGLHDSDATEYLESGIKLYQREDKPHLASLLEKHAQAIRQACRESSAGGSGQSYHPFYLDICLEALETHEEDFTPARHLGRTPKELMNRFFRYMDEDELSLHIALSMAVEFDWEVIDYLEKKNVIPPLTHTEFLQFAASHSYVLNTEKVDSFRFNRLIHESLKTYIFTLDDERKYALRRSVLAGLLSYYDEQLPGASTQANQGMSHITRDYSRANMMLVCATESGLLTMQDAFARHHRWALRYPKDFFQLRVAWDRKWVKLHVHRHGAEHPQTREAMLGWLGTVDDMLGEARRMIF